MNHIHELKITPLYYEAVASGRKKFEYRINDRDFREMDMLRFREYNPEVCSYTGRELLALVTYVLPINGFAILSIDVFAECEDSVS